MIKKTGLSVMLLAFSLTFWTCSSSRGGGFNLFTIEQDLQLGQQVKTQIESNPSEFPIIPESQNPEAYRIIKDITNEILNSGKVKYRSEFPWEVKLIKDDKTLNAFCTPGGYIYVYSGLIKFLDKEDELAGVMGHEIAHADQRHSTRQLTKMYGISALLQVASGRQTSENTELLKQIAASLISLKFSRNHETEADNYSVVYLGGTRYNCAGAAGFFRKMEGNSSPPEFLSTHPNPGNRVQNIESQAQEAACSVANVADQTRYQRLKAIL